MFWLYTCDWKIEFLTDHHCKKHFRTFWFLRKRQKLLVFLQSALYPVLFVQLWWFALFTVHYSCSQVSECEFYTWTVFYSAVCYHSLGVNDALQSHTYLLDEMYSLLDEGRYCIVTGVDQWSAYCIINPGSSSFTVHCPEGFLLFWLFSFISECYRLMKIKMHIG